MSLQPFEDPHDVHFPKCPCPVAPVLDFQRQEFKNGSLHVYRFCKTCKRKARSPVPRTSIPLSKWRELLIASGQEVNRL